MSFNEGATVLFEFCVATVFMAASADHACLFVEEPSYEDVVGRLEARATSPELDMPLGASVAGTSAQSHDAPEEVGANPTMLLNSRTIWDDLADCESGNWIKGGFEEGSARWHMSGTDHRAQPQPAWGNGLFYGGVQFSLESWAWAADVGGHDVDPNPANNSREQQIAVAETLLELQGWVAWPSCSKKLGLR